MHELVYEVTLHATICLFPQPICQAAYDNDLQKVYHIVKEDAKTLNVQDEESGDTPIIAACRCGNIQMVKYLLDLKADVAIRNKVVEMQF